MWGVYLPSGVTYYAFLPPFWGSCRMVTVYLILSFLLVTTRSPRSVVHCDCLEGLFIKRMLVPLLGLLIQWVWGRAQEYCLSRCFEWVLSLCWWAVGTTHSLSCLGFSVFQSNKVNLCADRNQGKTQEWFFLKKKKRRKEEKGVRSHEERSHAGLLDPRIHQGLKRAAGLWFSVTHSSGFC